MHGSTYIGSSEIKGGKELAFPRVDVKCANKDVNQKLPTSLLIPHYVSSLSCSMPTSKMGMGMLPCFLGRGQEQVKLLAPSLAFRLAALATSFCFLEVGVEVDGMEYYQS